MKVEVRYNQGAQFSAIAGSHQFIIDLSKEKGGGDTGMSPLEVFLLSVGGCVAVYAQKYCQGAKIDTAGLTVEVQSDLSEEKPVRFQDIKVAVRLSRDLGDKKEAFLRFVKNCPIHNTVAHGAAIDISVQ